MGRVSSSQYYCYSINCIELYTFHENPKKEKRKNLTTETMTRLPAPEVNDAAANHESAL